MYMVTLIYFLVYAGNIDHTKTWLSSFMNLSPLRFYSHLTKEQHLALCLMITNRSVSFLQIGFAIQGKSILEILVGRFLYDYFFIKILYILINYLSNSCWLKLSYFTIKLTALIKQYGDMRMWGINKHTLKFWARNFTEIKLGEVKLSEAK